MGAVVIIETVDTALVCRNTLLQDGRHLTGREVVFFLLIDLVALLNLLEQVLLVGGGWVVCLSSQITCFNAADCGEVLLPLALDHRMFLQCLVQELFGIAVHLIIFINVEFVALQHHLLDGETAVHKLIDFDQLDSLAALVLLDNIGDLFEKLLKLSRVHLQPLPIHFIVDFIQQPVPSFLLAQLLLIGLVHLIECAA